MDCCLDIEFLTICGKDFYFNEKGPEKDLDSDNFHICDHIQPCQRLIRSKDHKCLFLDGQNLLACRLTKILELGCKFFLQLYNDSTSDSPGRAAIMYSQKDERKWLVCCNENNEVYAEEMDLPSMIAESQHKAVFYLWESSASNTYTFESSQYRGRFLRFEPDENNPSVKKLVLHHKTSDDPDDSEHIRL